MMRTVTGGSAPRQILILTPIYPWPGDPPEGIFVHRQIQNLTRLGVRCRVLTYHPAVRGLPRTLTACSWLRYHPRWMTWPKEHDGIHIAHTFYPRRFEPGEDVIPAIGQSLIRFIETHVAYQQTDVVYAHWLWTGGAAALRLREHFGWPVAAIARGSEMHYWQHLFPLCRAYVERVLNEADLMLANCNGLRSIADDIAPGASARIRVVYNGCDARVFRPADDRETMRRILRLPVHANLLLCCASLIDRKGIAELIKAWRIFSPRHPTWVLVLVGRTVQRNLVEELRRCGATKINVIGQVAAERVALYMQAADGYIQPSRLEGLANATMEAMACALPVIATDTGGQREAVRGGETGWLVPPCDSDALVAAMDALASDMAAARGLGLAARRRIEADFDPLVHAARLRSLLLGLVEQGPVAVA
jgi:teichuronic acid biosynthesis glycosyltransferase TuaC